MKIQRLLSPLETNCSNAMSKKGWYMLNSPFLNDEVVVVSDPQDLSIAQKAYPNQVIYLSTELDELCKAPEDYISKVHLVKRLLRGQILYTRSIAR